MALAATNRAQVREFLASRRARIAPASAGLPAYGGNRRVKGLREKRSRYSRGSASTTTSGWNAATSPEPPRWSSTVLRTHWV